MNIREKVVSQMYFGPKMQVGPKNAFFQGRAYYLLEAFRGRRVAQNNSKHSLGLMEPPRTVLERGA